jgi:hypothetical protein
MLNPLRLKSVSLDEFVRNLRGEATTLFDVTAPASVAARGASQKVMEFITETGRNPFSVTDDDRRRFIADQVAVTPQRVDEILAMPQRTDGWLAERRLRLTASDMAQAIGITPSYIVKDLAKHGFVDAAMALVLKKAVGLGVPERAAAAPGEPLGDMERGVQLEPTILDRLMRLLQQLYVVHMGARRIWMVGEGLRVDIDRPWLAASNDGWLFIEWADDVVEVVNLEAKAPRTLHHDIPRHYYPQILAEMNVWRRSDGRRYADRTIFTQYVESGQNGAQQSAAVYDFDEHYWNDIVLPRAERFYMDALLPALILRERGVLTDPIEIVGRL